jgi:uncharacterized membrane protein YfhO
MSTSSETIEHDSDLGGGMLAGALSYRLFVFFLPLAFFIAVNHQTTIGGIITLVAFEFVLAGLWLIISLQLSHADARWTDLIPGSLL